jgi:hypothetical protein
LGLLVVLLVAVILFAPARFKIETVPENSRPQYFRPRQKRGLQRGAGADFGRFRGIDRKRLAAGHPVFAGFPAAAGAHNDFIFSVIAEEEGFVGSVVVLALYTVLLFSGIKIASQARDRLGQLLAVGVVTLVVLPRLYQHRNEYSLNARDGHPTAAAELWRVLGGMLADRHRHFAQRPHLSEVLINYE